MPALDANGGSALDAMPLPMIPGIVALPHGRGAHYFEDSGQGERRRRPKTDSEGQYSGRCLCRCNRAPGNAQLPISTWNSPDGRYPRHLQTERRKRRAEDALGWAPVRMPCTPTGHPYRFPLS